MPYGWHQTARIDIKQGLGLLVRVDFDVLIWNTFQFKGDPDTLNERARRG
jgi:hypothetical protein